MNYNASGWWWPVAGASWPLLSDLDLVTGIMSVYGGGRKLSLLAHISHLLFYYKIYPLCNKSRFDPLVIFVWPSKIIY